MFVGLDNAFSVVRISKRTVLLKLCPISVNNIAYMQLQKRKKGTAGYLLMQSMRDPIYGPKLGVGYDERPHSQPDTGEQD
ncbi:hypothetical protein CW304_29285 [Bacillus sp. UFRGS-B20]|nr:hypothetical protein CW304_29285 [Bacillus sp. UFRGS-B20]